VILKRFSLTDAGLHLTRSKLAGPPPTGSDATPRGEQQLEVLLRVNTEAPERWAFQVWQSHRTSGQCESDGMFTDRDRWDCWECQAPGTPLLSHVQTPSVGFATGYPADIGGLGGTSRAYSSPALLWFIIRTRCLPDWFRILSPRLGRTGRLRRTGRNPLRSDRFPRHERAACQVTATVGNSGMTYDRWAVSQSDRAYPRPEGCGIAPVQSTNPVEPTAEIAVLARYCLFIINRFLSHNIAE
jgi:hypothetical protein